MRACTIVWAVSLSIISLNISQLRLSSLKYCQLVLPFNTSRHLSSLPNIHQTSTQISRTNIRKLPRSMSAAPSFILCSALDALQCVVVLGGMLDEQHHDSPRDEVVTLLHPRLDLVLRGVQGTTQNVSLGRNPFLTQVLHAFT